MMNDEMRLSIQHSAFSIQPLAPKKALRPGDLHFSALDLF